jgi:hypothetical protein
MTVRSWVRKLFTRTVTHPIKAPPRCRPAVEALEDRTLLNGYVAATVAELITDIGLANAAGGTNRISLNAPSAHFTLSSVDNTTDGATGLPVIAAGDNLIIVGNGDTIERSTASGTPAFRLLDVSAGATLKLENLTLTNGLASGSGVSAQGGAIYSQGDLLTLDRVIVQNNTAQGANGGDGVGDGGNGGNGGAAFGGGVYVARGTATLTNSTLSGNLANGGGGGYGSNGDINSGGNGGGGGSAFGGGVYVAGGTLTLTNDTLSGNSTQGGNGGNGGIGGTGGTTGGNGGVGSSGDGGGVYAAGGAVTLTNDTLSGNSAQGGGGGSGGNGSSGDGGRAGAGGSASGGGVHAAGGTLTLTNDTLSGNRAQGGEGGNGGGAGGRNGSVGRAGNGGNASGGGLDIVSGSTMTLTNTLIAHDTVTAGTRGSTGYQGSAGSATDPDVSGNVTSSAHDLIGDGTGSNLSNSVNGNRVGTSASPLDPLLGPLQDNGGPTQTMALLPGSPALDAGDGTAPGLPSTDQRGFARISGTAVDIGAFEVQDPLFSTTALANGTYDTPYSQTLTATATGGAAGPLTFAVTSGTLPPGLSLASDGTLSGTPTAAGAYTFTVTATDSDSDTGSQSYTLTIDKAALTITANSTSKTYGQSLAFAGTEFTASGLVNGDTISGVTLTSAGAVANAGVAGAPYAIVASAAVGSGLDNYTIDYINGSLTVTPATPTVTVSDAGGTYNGSSFAASASVAGVVAGVDDTPAATLEGVAPTLSYFSGSYTSAAQLAGLTPLAAPPVNAGTYTVLATFPGSADYSSAQALVTFTITPATPTVSVSDAGGTYNGSAFSAQASAVGTDGTTPVSGSFSYTYYVGSGTSGTSLGSTAPTNAGTYTVVATFTSTDGNYTDGSAQTTFTINPAPLQGTANPVSDFSFESPSLAANSDQYNPTGSPWTFSGTSGIESNGSAFSAADAPDGTQAAFLQSQNSGNPGQISQTVTLNPGTYYISFWAAQRQGYGVNPIQVQVDGQNVGSPISPASTSWALYQTVSFTITSAGSHTIAFVATRPSSGDNDSFIDAVTVVPPSSDYIAVTDTGGTYNGNPFSANATAVGIGGTTPVSGSFSYTYYVGSGTSGTSLGSTAPTSAGTYTVVVTFTSTDGNYTGGSAQTTFTITPAAPTLTVSDAGGTFNGSAFAAAAQVNGSASLEGVSPTLTYYAGSQASGTPLSGAPSAAGTYTVVATFAGSADYSAATSNPVTFTISPAAPSVSVSDAGGTFNGAAFAAAAQVNGSASLEGVGPTLTYYAGSQASGTPLAGAPSAAGTYTVVATFAGSADYAAATSAPLTFTIAKASPTVTWANPADITYGTALGATQLDATADVPGTFSYAPAAGTVLGASSQTLSVTFTPTDTADYSSASATVPLTIDPAHLSATPLNFSAAVGVPFSGAVATFANADPLSTPGSYSATISWGDGSTSAGTISDSGGTFTVSGSHLFTSPGSYSVRVQIRHNQGHTTTATTSGTATVSSDVVLTGTGGDNLVLMRTAGGGLGDVTYTLNGAAPVSLHGVTSFTFNGAGNDTMTVSLANGAPLPGNGAITFNGGTGFNTLTLDAAGLPVGTIAGGFSAAGQVVNFSNASTTHINSAAVDAFAGPDTADRATAVTGLSAQEQFVQALYLDELGRVGSKAELDRWVNGVLDQPGGSPQAVAADIAGSAEAQDHLVQSWYVAFLGRPAQGGEEQGWVHLLQSGLSEEQVLSRILGEPGHEFYNRAQTLGFGGTADQNYAQALYQLLLGRQASSGELAGAVSALQGAGAQGLALGVLGSTEFRTDQFTGYYEVLLQRPADAGLAGWVASGLDASAVRVAFESGSEFVANG